MDSLARRRRIGTLLVAAQFALIGLCLVPAGPVVGDGARWLGLASLTAAVAVGALAWRALGADTRVNPVPAASGRLRTSGIYSVIRHPMYAAVLLACLGVTLSGARVLSAVALVVLGVLLHGKARFEDRMLRERFGPQFVAYAAAVPAILPRPRRPR